MLAGSEKTKDLDDTEHMLITLAEQDKLIKKRVVIVIMERVIQLWIELKIESQPHGNWQFTEQDRKALRSEPGKVKHLLSIIESRALPIH